MIKAVSMPDEFEEKPRVLVLYAKMMPILPWIRLVLTSEIQSLCQNYPGSLPGFGE